MFLWMDEKRAQYQEKYPEMSNTEISRHMAQAWNKLSEEKKVNVFLGASLQLTRFLLLLENLAKRGVLVQEISWNSQIIF